MNVDKAVFVFAGLVVLTSIALARWVHPAWILLAVFAALNMIQAAFTGFCPAALVFKRLGIGLGPAFR